MSKRVRISAPGSLMLMGEHAVLQGRQALACAVNRRISFEFMARDDGRVCLTSSLGCLEVGVADFCFQPELRFAGTALQRYLDRLPGGVDVRIDADFSSTVGLGSSAAVAVGMVTGLRSLCGESFSRELIFDEALQVVLDVQGRGSGTDVAACVFGGVVQYRIQPREIQSLAVSFPLLLVYCGYKTPTVKVIEKVERARRNQPEAYERFFDVLDTCVSEGCEAARKNDLAVLGEWMNTHQSVMVEMALNTPELDEIVEAMRAMPGVMGAKISGSGLGDCALALGEGAWMLDRYDQIAVQVDENGVLVDE